MSNDIEARVRLILGRNLGNVVPAEQISMEEDLLDCGLTSNNYIKLIVSLEKEFGIEVPEEDMTIDNFMTINRIMSYIHTKI
ncbi:MAG: phosphopantetheine-binding protein [Clostridia bacterium]|nr:phosphopantetheine-binding protein [Clostridia bacterium]